MRCLRRRSFVLLLSLTLLGTCANAAKPVPGKTKYVVLVMLDGVRWQEVFTGPERALMTNAHGVDDVAALEARVWQPTPEARRARLMPFLWSEVLSRGQLFGDRSTGGGANVTNGKDFSAPGYSETLCGFADERVRSNAKVPNPNVTVFEWLSRRPGFEGRVSGFAGWDVLPFIFNTARAGFVINTGQEPITHGKPSPTMELYTRLRAQTPSAFDDLHYDSLVANPAIEWLRENHPRVFFLGLGETDEWAHQDDYPHYLQALSRADAYLAQLWRVVQADPELAGRTTLLVTTDHGRGDGPAWKDHGAEHAGSNATWLAVLGPDTAPLGVRSVKVTNAQVAATIAALLGEDYGAAEARAAPFLVEVTAKAPKR